MTVSTEHYPVGQQMEVTYPAFKVILTLQSPTQMTFEIEERAFAHTETVAVEVAPLGYGMFAVSWQEQSGANVVNVQDYDRGIVRSFVTLPGGDLLRMTGTIVIRRPADRVSDNRLGAIQKTGARSNGRALPAS